MTLVGSVSVRHALNDHLARVGGHIGYAVQPAFRRCGYATEMLHQALEVAAGLGIPPVLVTCNADNVGSIRAIKRCGGVFSQTLDATADDPAKRHYWFDLSTTA